jgi:hypothetical protein
MKNIVFGFYASQNFEIKELFDFLAPANEKRYQQQQPPPSSCEAHDAWHGCILIDHKRFSKGLSPRVASLFCFTS